MCTHTHATHSTLTSFMRKRQQLRKEHINKLLDAGSKEKKKKGQGGNTFSQVCPIHFLNPETTLLLLQNVLHRRPTLQEREVQVEHEGGAWRQAKTCSQTPSAETVYDESQDKHRLHTSTHFANRNPSHIYAHLLYRISTCRNAIMYK